MASLPANEPMSSPPESTAIIREASALTAKIAFWQQQGLHVLSPAIQIAELPQNFGVNVAMVVLNPDEQAGDVYRDPSLMGEDERAISRIGLDKIASCAGVSWLPGSGRRGDPRIQNLWEYQAVGAFVAYDGTPQIITGTAEVDLRDGSAQVGGWSPEGWARLLADNEAKCAGKTGDERERIRKGLKWTIGGWSDARVMQARRFGLRLCESKSKNAAIRSLGLKSKYTVAELQKPFVVLRVSYLPDMQDPGVRQMVASRGMAGASALYGAPQGEVLQFRRDAAPQDAQEPINVTPERAVYAAEPPVATVAPAPVPPTSAAPAPVSTPPVAAVSTPAVTPAAPASALPATKPPLPTGATYIQRVEAQEKTKKAGGTFTKWTVIDGNGVAHVTVFRKVGEAALRFYETGTPVFIKSTYNEQYREHQIEAIEKAGEPTGDGPSLPLGEGFTL